MDSPQIKYIKPLLMYLVSAACIASSLSQYQGDPNLSYSDVMALCEGNYIKAIAYPGDEEKYIICNYNAPTIGSCSDVTPGAPKKCFDAAQQSCSDACAPNYVQEITSYCQAQSLAMMTFLPANDCEHYYICMDSDDAIYGSCPKGMHFSRKYNKCMSPVEAECPQLHKVCESKANGYRYAASDCYQYYECQGRKAVLMSCNYGDYYDNVTGTCLNDRQNVCLSNSQRLPTCTAADDGRRYSHAKCHRFYICINSIPYEGQCGSDQHFDAATAKCENGSCAE